MRAPVLFLLPLLAYAQQPATVDSLPATLIANDQIELATLNQGGAFVRLTRQADPEKLNPMWTPAGRGSSRGHFLCVDGFGPTSEQERAAGLQGHGEAHRQPWKLISSGRNGKVQHLEWQTRLPLVQEKLTRKVELVDGEPVVYVDTALENELAFDRPINWAEHATIGYPFLRPEQTVVDASVGRCQTRPHNNIPPNRTLEGGKEFTYPVAPLQRGGVRDLRQVPNPPNSLDHTGCVVNPADRLGWVTAIQLEKRVVFGYLFRREEYPWLQEWLNYPANMALSRGLEFGTQPFDVPRREAIEMNRMFDTPTYRWLPAKSRITSRFLMFYAPVPAGFKKVDSVRQENGELILTDQAAKLTVRILASLPL